MRASRTAAFYEKEILKYGVGIEAVKNTVIDCEEVVVNADGRLILEAGQVICQTSPATLSRPAAASAEATVDIIGILAHTIEFWGNDDQAYNEPGALFFWNAIFDTTKLVDYSGNAANVKAALPSCKFE